MHPEGALPHMGYIGMCRREGYGFQAVYSRGRHLSIFWVGICRPGLQIGTPF